MTARTQSPVAVRTPISTGSEWTFELIHQYDQEIARLAAEFRLDTYPNQIEVIRSDQMLDAYASIGMPLGYTTGRSANTSSNRSAATSAATWVSRTRS